MRVSKAITQNWSAKLEYLYRDLGTLLVRSVHVGTGLHDHCQRIVAIYRHILRAGINYQFGGPAVSKY